jgi:putative ABC transport system permease protein
MKEVAVRKTFGAQRRQLIYQFLGESIVVTVVALLIGLAVAEVLGWGLSSLVPVVHMSNPFTDPSLLIAVLLLTLLVGLAAGFYPAIVLSRFQPTKIFQKRAENRAGRSWLRKGLVVFQFILSILFVLSTVINQQQANLVNSMDLGFDKNNMMVLRFDGDDPYGECQLFKSEIVGSGSVISAAATDHRMGTRRWTWAFNPNPGTTDSTILRVKRYEVDHDFISTFDVELLAGRNFSPNRPEDVDHAILISESLIEDLELGDPIGYTMYLMEDERTYEVVGVVENFLGTSVNWSYGRGGAHSILRYEPNECRYLNVKLPDNDISGSIATISNKFGELFPGRDFNYTFLDEEIQAEYSELNEMVRVFGVLAAISIAVACLGIFGLVSYSARQKTREIGIRRVLGASVASIVKLLGKEYLILIIVANVIAWPSAYWLNGLWLQEYAFRVELGIVTFISGGFLTLVLALLTTTGQSLKAARMNPVDTLRHE